MQGVALFYLPQHKKSRWLLVWQKYVHLLGEQNVCSKRKFFMVEVFFLCPDCNEITRGDCTGKPSDLVTCRKCKKSFDAGIATQCNTNQIVMFKEKNVYFSDKQ